MIHVSGATSDILQNDASAGLQAAAPHERGLRQKEYAVCVQTSKSITRTAAGVCLLKLQLLTLAAAAAALRLVFTSILKTHQPSCLQQRSIGSANGNPPCSPASCRRVISLSLRMCAYAKASAGDDAALLSLLATPGICCLIAQVGLGQQLAVFSYQALPQLPITSVPGRFRSSCNAQPKCMQLGWKTICLCSTEQQVAPYVLHADIIYSQL